jgi:hypothetical protein
MTRWQCFGATVLGGAILLTLWLSSAIWAQQPRLEYPPHGPCSCVPDVMHFGFHEATWRRWPGEVRLEQINPHAPTSELLPTPEGREIVPPPKAAQQPQGEQPPPQGQQQQPPSNQGEIDIPKSGFIRPPEGTLLPAIPGKSENKPGGNKPSTEGDLPGLDEPIKPLDTVPPAKPPAIPAIKPPAEKPTKSPEKSPKSSMREDEPKLGSPTGVTATYPAQPANAQPRRQEVWQKNDQPPLPADGGTRTDTVVALAGRMEPERSSLPPSAYRADAIGVTTESANPVEPAAYAFAESPPKPAAVNHSALPSVALGGYCPVELGGNGRWVLGDLRWTVVYRNWIYRLSGPEQRRRFLADPDRFAPVDSGNDVVMSVSKNCSVPGKTAYCAIYENRLYMFSSEATQAEFNRTPQRFATKR